MESAFGQPRPGARAVVELIAEIETFGIGQKIESYMIAELLPAAECAGPMARLRMKKTPRQVKGPAGRSVASDQRSMVRTTGPSGRPSTSARTGARPMF
jgi:hypothetical protein